MQKTVITMLRNASRSLGCPLGEGETGPVESALATELVRIGVAVEVEYPKQIRGVPEVPTIMAEQPREQPAEPVADRPRRVK